MKKISTFSVFVFLAASVFARPNLINKKNYNHSEVNNLVFRLTSEELEIKETVDSYINIEVYCNNKSFAPEVKLEGQTLSINSRNRNSISLFGGTSCSVVMYIPLGMSFNNIDIKKTSGQTQIDPALTAHTIYLQSLSGSIDINGGLFADTITIKSTSGEIEAQNLDADDLIIESTSGEIELEKYTGGTGSIRTTSGDIEVSDFAVEYAKFKTTSGDISVKNLDCDYFDFESTSGSQTTTLRNPPLAKSKMEATSGSIDITIPEGSSFEVDVHSNSGTFKDGFSNNKFVPRSTFHERINDGGAVIELITSSGDIDLDY